MHKQIGAFPDASNNVPARVVCEEIKVVVEPIGGIRLLEPLSQS